MVKLKPGDIALCQRGRVGMILKVKKADHGYLYTGIQLLHSDIGKPWQSVNPLKRANITTLLMETL